MALIKLGAKAYKAGSVIQTVNSNITYHSNTNSTTYVDINSASSTAWETSITPISSSSKILIIPSISVYALNSSNAEARYALRMQGKIGSGSYTTIGDTNDVVRLGNYDYGASGTINGAYVCPVFLWSPSSTDELKVKFKVKGNGGDIHVSIENQRSTVTLQEIAQ